MIIIFPARPYTGETSKSQFEISIQKNFLELMFKIELEKNLRKYTNCYENNFWSLDIWERISSPIIMRKTICLYLFYESRNKA